MPMQNKAVEITPESPTTEVDNNEILTLLQNLIEDDQVSHKLATNSTPSGRLGERTFKLKDDPVASHIMTLIKDKNLGKKISVCLNTLLKKRTALFSEAPQYNRIQDTEDEIEALKDERRELNYFIDECRDSEGRRELEDEQRGITQQIRVLEQDKVNLALEIIAPLLSRQFGAKLADPS